MSEHDKKYKKEIVKKKILWKISGWFIGGLEPYEGVLFKLTMNDETEKIGKYIVSEKGEMIFTDINTKKTETIASKDLHHIYMDSEDVYEVDRRLHEHLEKKGKNK